MIMDYMGQMFSSEKPEHSFGISLFNKVFAQYWNNRRPEWASIELLATDAFSPIAWYDIEKYMEPYGQEQRLSETLATAYTAHLYRALWRNGRNPSMKPSDSSVLEWIVKMNCPPVLYEWRNV